MTLNEQIKNDMKTALLGGNRFKGEVLRNLRAAIINEEVALNKREVGLNDAEIEKILVREVKKRYESSALYEQNERQDSADQELREAKILEVYLPEKMNEAEIKTVVDAKIAELNIDDVKKMGQVIGAVKADIGNAADGATISRLVKEKLLSL